MILQEAGYEVEEALGGKDAINRFEKVSPDLVMMDIIMPEIDGIAVVKIINNLHPQAKIIMCSTLGRKEKVIEAVQAGAIGFIVKPFEILGAKIFALVVQLIFSGLIGIFFVYWIDKVRKRNILLKGLIFGMSVWFLTYTITILFKLKPLDKKNS